jgi:DNA ligase-4
VTSFLVLYKLRFRYLFHATDSRKQSEDYGLEDEDEDEDDTTDQNIAHAAPEGQPSAQSQSKDEEVNVDPSLAGWLQVNEDGPGNAEQEGAMVDGSDTETDNDSDNEDVKSVADAAQEWTDVVVPGESGQSSLTLSVCPPLFLEVTNG